MTDSPTIELYEHTVSSYVQKIKIALREKGIPYKGIVPASFSSGQRTSDTFSSVNPRLEVPVLVDHNTGNKDPVAIFDSTVILEYIEDAYPDPPLLHGSPSDRARARLIEEVCDTHYEAINWGLGEIVWMGRAEHDPALEKSLKEKAAKQTQVVLEWLEGHLGDDEWFGGKKFGWADLCIAPILNRSVYYGNNPKEGSKLSSWFERVRQRESVRKTFEEFHAAAGKMGGMKDAFKSGERKREYRDHRLEWMIKSGGLEIVQDGLKNNNIRFAWPSAD